MNKDHKNLISIWQDEVQTSHPSRASSLVTTGYGPNQIRLRNTPRRAGLKEILGNSRKRKRDIQDESEWQVPAMDDYAPKKCGRPIKQDAAVRA